MIGRFDLLFVNPLGPSLHLFQAEHITSTYYSLGSMIAIWSEVEKRGKDMDVTDTSLFFPSS